MLCHGSDHLKSISKGLVNMVFNIKEINHEFKIWCILDDILFKYGEYNILDDIIFFLKKNIEIATY